MLERLLCNIGSDTEIFEHVETMLDIIEPEIMYAGSVSTGEHNHGHISISQVLKILALNDNLPLHIPLDLIKCTLKGAANGVGQLERDTYKMRLTVDALLSKASQAYTTRGTGVRDQSANRRSVNSDSDDNTVSVSLSRNVI